MSQSHIVHVDGKKNEENPFHGKYAAVAVDHFDLFELSCKDSYKSVVAVCTCVHVSS